ncbi:MAG: type II secretion system protein [Alphaproteobacteria bacterium]|nr:type II secretion system protein [Alphaproteobacteria bacterium]MBR6010610.1 type II secretion system protein [Alphaproteobacteria bacterium]
MRQESGRSMIEMVGVLAIMGMLTATAFALISLGINRQKQARVVDDVVTIVSGVRSLLGDYDDFSNIDNATIFGAISVSNKNPYGGTYELAVDNSNTRQFIVKINGLSKSDCEALKTKAWADSVGYISSDHKESGASANCVDGNENVVSIVYGE